MSELSEATEARKLAAIRRSRAEKVQQPRPAQVSPLLALHKHLGNRRVSRALAEADRDGRGTIAAASRQGSSALLLRALEAGATLDHGQDEEDVQAKHDAALAMRQEIPEEEEEVQAKHDAAPAMRQEIPEEEEEVQAKHDAAPAMRQEIPEEEELLTKRADDPAAPGAAPTLGLEGGLLDDAPAQRIEALRGGGSALDPGIQGRMEDSFGVGFDGVRVHQDPESDAIARGMSARAFTTGSDIFLSQNERPGDTSLLAHELAHVVQQSSGSTAPQSAGLSVGPADDPLEAEADRAAALVNSGASAGALFREERS